MKIKQNLYSIRNRNDITWVFATCFTLIICGILILFFKIPESRITPLMTIGIVWMLKGIIGLTQIAVERR